jgi:hypothetical protein
MRIKLIAIGIISTLIVIAIPVASAPQVNADNTTEELTLEQKIIERQKELEELKRKELEKVPPPEPYTVIAPPLKEILSGMSPTDNISVLIYLRGDPSLDQKIQDIWEGQPDDEMHRLEEQLREKWRQYPGFTDQSIVERLTELNDAKGRQVLSLHEQAYAELHKRIIQRIEQLADTTVTYDFIFDNSLGVYTKVSNIEALAAIPEIVRIYDNPKGSIGPFYLGFVLLSPSNGSFNCLANRLSFTWSPYKEATKYQFMLAKDTAMTQVVKEAELTDTNYIYKGKLDYGTNYFWQVMVIEPVHSDWSATFSFQTEAAPTPAPPTPWSPILTAGLVIAFAAAIGILTWFLVVRSRRGKMKTSE